jgi:catechol 2,3-dioxygenase-like lactoylglutathione lyase family enzyme
MPERALPDWECPVVLSAEITPDGMSLAIVIISVRSSGSVSVLTADDSSPTCPTFYRMRLIMHSDIAETLVDDFEQGLLSRRQLVSRLMGLGAALAVTPGAGLARQGDGATFQATGLDHVALNVSSVPRSRDFYVKHLGLKVIRESGEDNCFLGGGDDFFLTLFRGERPGLNHYCYAIKGYDPARAEEKLKAAGLKPRREGNRVYFPDVDGIEVQVAGS